MQGNQHIWLTESRGSSRRGQHTSEELCRLCQCTDGPLIHDADGFSSPADVWWMVLCLRTHPTVLAWMHHGMHWKSHPGTLCLMKTRRAQVQNQSRQAETAFIRLMEKIPLTGKNIRNKNDVTAWRKNHRRWQEHILRAEEGTGSRWAGVGGGQPRLRGKCEKI